MKHQPKRNRCEECGERMTLEQSFVPGRSFWSCKPCYRKWADAVGSNPKMRTARIKRRGQFRTVHWNKTMGQVPGRKETQ